MPPFPEPTVPADGRAEVFLRYLDYFRDSVVEKVAGLAEEERRNSRLPSGWTPLELLKHLRHVELRWIEWGFEGRDVATRGAISGTVGGTWRRRRASRS